ncbi:uncharacterized protein LOC132747103 [Ruditapes philippinarum]|uniref:uncharacterized protein LOC132747103 n=1 Tax=Ruditapes philippinarum TaxID=129788 RepID=UPI00295A6748|nr:uncharacterized protein LOC132747103 [Ruditapes philippinarum]
MGPCINVALSSSMSDSFMEKPRFSLAQMFLVGGLSFFLGGSASIALYCYVSSFRRAMREAKQNERKQKLERKMSEQRLSKRQSQASIRTVPHMSSHTRLDDGYTSGRSKFYDVDTVIRDSPNRMSMGVSHSTPSQMSLDNVFGGRSKVYDVENVMKDNPEQEETYYSTIDKKCALKTFTIKDL